MAAPPGSATGTDRSGVNAVELIEELAELSAESDITAVREKLTETKQLILVASERGLIDPGLRVLDSRDTAEAFVGSVIFATPLLVEDGVFDIAAHLIGVTVAGLPVFLMANVLFVVFMTYALLQWTGQRQADTHVLFGRVPARVVMILGVSFVVGAVLMTIWGRVGNWRAPMEAFARINVLWAVGSLGAALGDIVSERDAPDKAAFERVTDVELDPVRDPASVETLSDRELLSSLREQFEELDTTVDSEGSSQSIERLTAGIEQSSQGSQFGQRIRKYTSRDIAEAFVGSVFFSFPFLVEDGVFDVASYFLAYRVDQIPVVFFLNAGFVVVMILALVYWAGPQNVRVSRPVFGLVPRRLIGISLVSFLTAALLMTLWGRVGNWQDPIVSVARISVVWTIASFGGALGDILPGESSGADISDELADFEASIDTRR